MRFKSGLRAAAIAGALVLPPCLAFAQAGGPPAPSARPGIGIGAYAPGQGPTGAAGWNAGSWRGYTNAYGPFWGGGYYGGGESDGGEIVARGGTANVVTYNHFDNRRRDGGFYGGGGVFYGDDGYSRLNAASPYEGAAFCRTPTRADDGAGTQERGSAHIIYLPDSNRRAARGGARQARQ